MEKEKELKRPTRDDAKEPDPERAPVDVQVAGSPTRCPYCHEGCGAEEVEVTVCQRCLSRHHGSCWREGGGRCASCAGTSALRPSAPAVVVSPAERALLGKNLPREAVDRLRRRLGLDEATALRALLEQACRDAEAAEQRFPPARVLVALVAALVFVLALCIPLLAILSR